MDNLVAAGKTQPFLIVMTYGMTNDKRPGGGGLRNFDIKPFQTVLLDELVPYVDANFRTIADPAQRAMAGLSMGGFETRTITLARPDGVTKAAEALKAAGFNAVSYVSPNTRHEFQT
jgi:enterochelin esterase-like enzyme